MAYIKFKITEEAGAYLDWLAREVLFVRSRHGAAKHLMMSRLEQVRREHRGNEPTQFLIKGQESSLDDPEEDED